MVAKLRDFYLEIKVFVMYTSNIDLILATEIGWHVFHNIFT